jgi:hypothetical protein
MKTRAAPRRSTIKADVAPAFNPVAYRLDVASQDPPESDFKTQMERKRNMTQIRKK